MINTKIRLITFFAAKEGAACASSSPACSMIYSAYKLSKQGGRELTTCKWFVSFYRSANQLQGIKSQWTASHGWPEREPQSPAAWPHTQLKKGPGDPERPGFTRETITSCAYTCSFLMSTLLTSWSMFESWAQSTRTATSRKRCLVCCSRHRWPHGARDKPLEADLGPQRLWLGPISFNI